VIDRGAAASKFVGDGCANRPIVISMRNTCRAVALAQSDP